MDKETIRSLSKVELHCHLDGSIQLSTLRKLAEKEQFPLEKLSKAAAPKKCLHLKEYLESFAVILPLLQSEENLAIAAYDLIEQAHAEAIRYIEIRFAPKLHQEEGLSIEQVLQAVVDGVTQAQQQFPVYAQVIVSAMRHHSDEENQQLVDVIQYMNSAVISGFDFAGDEQQRSNDTIKACTDYAAAAGLNLTLHAGECGCAQNVAAAIRLGAARIGHGVAIKDSPSIMQECAQKGTLLEMCPTSNIQTNAIENWEDYPIRDFMEQQINCCINTDNRTVSQTTLTNEFDQLSKHCGLGYSDMKQLTLNAIHGAFASSQVKAQVIDQINTDYDNVILSENE
ncbi:adenosine deaminase [Enterococcus florum]|uniref:adenosine deaminase n=1 Tax=Enterococcus florum TaxID=2480627 RepID=A0A4P5P6P1_9ENTE|nr:adenosine deaminase [Enterococcus florum]GCF93076.1 adenosine deaminase [Enterococcus florum]